MRSVLFFVLILAVVCSVAAFLVSGTIIGVVIILDMSVIVGIVVTVTTAVIHSILCVTCYIGHDVASVIDGMIDRLACVPRCIAYKILGILTDTAVVFLPIGVLRMHGRHLGTAGVISI